MVFNHFLADGSLDYRGFTRIVGERLLRNFFQGNVSTCPPPIFLPWKSGLCYFFLFIKRFYSYRGNKHALLHPLTHTHPHTHRKYFVLFLSKGISLASLIRAIKNYLASTQFYRLLLKESSAMRYLHIITNT